MKYIALHSSRLRSKMSLRALRYGQNKQSRNKIIILTENIKYHNIKHYEITSNKGMRKINYKEGSHTKLIFCQLKRQNELNKYKRRIFCSFTQFLFTHLVMPTAYVFLTMSSYVLLYPSPLVRISKSHLVRIERQLTILKV